MTTDVKQLIDETLALTGSSPPAMLENDAPVLDSANQGELYLIGLVGGKDVGKSSLVNAIVGQSITPPTSFGPGTEKVIAYVHESAREELQELLSRQVPGRFSVITHNIDRLSRQVLLDLPDIDSKYEDHIQITRRMLRHMLYPLWIQSVEKYADRRPQQLLAAVAEGNDPANFIFCLNKADQLSPQQADELREDFATRISHAVSLPSLPRIFLISAENPQKFDLPALREVLSKEKSTRTVEQSLTLATKRQDRSLLRWIETQRLSQQAQQLSRLQQDAEEQTAARIASPILERAIPALLDDPGQRMAMTGPAIRLRLSRWPIVNAIDALLWPALALVQKNLSATIAGSENPDAYLGSPVSSLVQTTFAQLRQLHPPLGPLYENRKLWESMDADAAANDLRRRFEGTIQQQRETLMRRVSRFHILFAPLRWLLTIGAVLWFPIVQPMLAKHSWRILIDVLSVSNLLQCATFLLIWFAALWVLLRWLTQRRVNRLIDRWKIAGPTDELSLAGQTMQWLDELLQPIHRRRQRIESLAQRADELRRQINGQEPALQVPA